MHPLYFEWDGEVMRPLHPQAADRQYVVGEHYFLDHREDRSMASHRHYFAVLMQAWQNLPEDIADRFPTPEHLRKYALVKTGFRDERNFVCHSRHEALRMAAFVKPMDEFAIVSCVGSSVVVLTAHSQSLRAMGKEKFQRSKDAVLDCVAELIGVLPDQLSESAVI